MSWPENKPKLQSGNDATEYEPLDLKVSSNREKMHRTSICAPLRFARTKIPRRSDTDHSVCPSSPPSPQHSSSSCGPLSPPQARDSESVGFQFFIPIGAGGGLLPHSTVQSAQRRDRRDSPEPAEEQLACRWLRCHLLFECLQDLVDHVTESHVKPERSSGYCCHWEGCARKGRGFNAR
ncbi:Zinc finger protein GLIS2 [Bagarius yarrelli]|uniref:Zinc finger protein GLIS2 n=1 Tax=Bagarius yarrelli TaxID=175774 RepID=A0A556TTW3_BAGYA|nr:Zinc finger protein GLIS2 [Bagarius yarrelli]